MRLPARGLTLLLATLAGSSVIGFAASLTLGTAGVGAAQAALPRCTSAAVTVVPTLTTTTVTSVTVGSLPAGCGGATVQVSVHNGLTSGSGSATVPGGGGSVAVTITPAVALTAVTQTDLVLSGP